MVTAIVKKSSDQYISFKCEGHSGFNRRGKDIVCAAISILTINTANSILSLSDTVITPIENDGFLSWDFEHGIDDKASLLMDSLIIGLQSIEDTYDKRYLTLKIEEV